VGLQHQGPLYRRQEGKTRSQCLERKLWIMARTNLGVVCRVF